LFEADVPKSDIGGEPADESPVGVVFQEVIEAVKRVFRDNGLEDVVVRKSGATPEFTASGKFHEVLPLRRADGRNMT
jgi:hypothetical protein